MSAPTPPAAIRLVIPVHDEGPRLAAFLGELVALAPRTDAPPTHLLVVDDGSRPAEARLHAEAVAEAARRLAGAGSRHGVSLLQLPDNQGKGAAIRLGWEAAGDPATWLGFVDGDGAVPAAEVWRVAARLGGTPAFDALLGTRAPRAGRRVRRTPVRALQGRVFALAIQLVLGLGLRDPQCGLKLFRAERLRPLLPALQERRWLLDLELLLPLVRGGARLAEEAIDWHEGEGSRLVAVVDPLRMLVGLFRLRARLGASPAEAVR